MRQPNKDEFYIQGLRKCVKCGELKLLNEFNKQTAGRNGFHSRCKECIKQDNLKYNTNPANKLKNQLSTARWRENNRDRYNETTLKWQQEHYEYIKTQSREWAIKNPERSAQRSKKFREKNPEYMKNYRENNKEKIKEYKKNWELQNINYHTDWRKNKYKNDIEFRLMCILRATISERLKKDKNDRTINLIGCTIEEYKLNLEKQFLPEMNWDNYGDVWEIDHIIPISSFDLTKIEEQQKCFHYTNMQPLFKTTEIAKSFGYENYIGNRNKSKY